MTRRARLMVGAIALFAPVGLTSCSSSAGDDDPAQPPSPSATPDRPTDDATVAEPERPRPTRYEPHAAEVDGAAKRVAARAVEALPAVRQVTYTQYFGYLPPEASILVEADFRSGGGTTYDVRLRETAEGWRTASVTPAADLSPVEEPGRLARRVLDSDRIDLPWAGRKDVAAGLVAEPVLRSMLAVAEHHRIGISVLISAHPVNVFGTDRRSNHPDGQAYDIGSIDGRLVVDPDTAGLVRRVMGIAADTGAYQVGGPVDPDADGSQYFSDLTHSDHVHVGFDGPAVRP
ncbi:hypothetical protein HNR19_001347 [Nocardioides thalensis]|uniref:Peptidase M15A C-terminal domain-containing protein n=1 Tax=Nocardioides thalensis TaxID=1914755 RepID=A0A853BZS0_9ACTN|nr:hypothetical protein [Nocardioides thalensis]NYJ00649.1 hypothetical protein [Nocardioides thalensis]